MKIPNGFFVNNLIFFGESLSSETLLSKGFFLSFPDTKALSIEKKNIVHQQIRIFLGFLGDEYAMQVHWHVDNDYLDVLENYKNCIQSERKWSKFCRDERYNRYKGMMERGMLRKEKLAIFLSKKCNTLPKKALKVKEQIRSFLESQEREFVEKIRTISEIFPEAYVQIMQDQDHLMLYKKFLNPSLVRLMPFQSSITQNHDFSLSILENTLTSDGVCTSQDGHTYFKFDDHYHALIVVRRWPRQTYPGIINLLTNALPLDYTITQNIFPLSIEEEIIKEEKEIEWLEAVVRQSKKGSLLSSVNKKERKIQALMDGYILPYKVLTVIRIWDVNLRNLAAKSLAIKAALSAMNGAYYHQVSNPGQAHSLFFETFPGWTGGTTRAWDVYAQNDYLADLMPFSTTFTGALSSGESIYEGAHNNIVGIRTFSGNTPQHAVLIGMTGAGKSIAVCDLLSQTEPFYGFTAIIEEGLSYGVYTKLMGSQPIIIHPDSGLTLNYFDTNKSPLTSEHVAMAANVCLKMVGSHTDESVNNIRLAMLSEYIHQLYWEKLEEWQYVNKEKFKEICRFSRTLEFYKKENTKFKTINILDTYFILLEKYKDRAPDFMLIFEKWTESELIEFSNHFEHKSLIRDITCAYFDRKDFPTHAQLVESMRYAKHEHHDPNEVNYIATLLSAWVKDGGKYGPIFDGPSNINLTGNIVHFELGAIPESAIKLKEAVGFLIANYIRQYIISLPRQIKKRIIFEEASRFMNVPGGQEILAEAYAQLRKYGCWVLCVTQQYSQLKKSNLRSVIFGNSKLFLLMKQNDRKDLEEIAQDIGLPDTAQEEILRFPLPEHQIDSESKCSYMHVFSIDGGSAVSGIAKIRVSPAMLYVASSEGKIFDQRSKDLEGEEDTFIKVMQQVSELKYK